MSVNNIINQESLFIEKSDYKLHLRHIWKNSGGVPIFMLHGAIENGLIFYTKKGKGLACYLAEQGFDVYIADLRGRGQSTPLIDENSIHGQFESITQDIPAFIDFIQQRCQQPLHFIAHSWGGVLFASFLARFPEYLPFIRSKTCFGTKRMVTVRSVEKLLKVNFFWNTFAPKLAKRRGFLDAINHNVGSDNETIRSLEHSVAWVKKGDWHDPEDGFDYKKASSKIVWPPTWHITGIKDKVLGHAQDVQLFIKESGNHQAKFSLLAKKSGSKVDYDHINILTHPSSVTDHFPQLLLWLEKH